VENLVGHKKGGDALDTLSRKPRRESGSFLAFYRLLSLEVWLPVKIMLLFALFAEDDTFPMLRIGRLIADGDVQRCQ
jgi:hypothetical protein